MHTEILTDNISLASRAIINGDLVAVPTETVYGLSANGLDPKAIEKIYIVKGRPENKPINLLVSDMTMVESFCMDIPEYAYILASKFWPGPLTMILNKQSIVPDILTSGLNTVGVRCPDHPLTLDLIKYSSLPLATPSANISGKPSPKTCEEVLAYFDGLIPYVIDGGRCSIGIESTIVDLTLSRPRILRSGGLSAESIENALKTEVIK